MQTFPKWRRRLYFYLCIVVFLIVIPILVLYAQGYRFAKNWTLSPTGGILLSVPISGADIFINGKLSEQSAFLRHTILIQNLTDEVHLVEVKKDGYFTWTKHLPVVDSLVTEASPFLILKEGVLEEIPKVLEVSSSSAPIVSPDFTAVQDLFAKKIATSTSDIFQDLVEKSNFVYQGNLGLWSEGNKIFAAWRGGVDATPSFFCKSDVCSATTTVFQSAFPLTRLDFYPGRSDGMIIALRDGVYVVELDTRDPQNVFPLMKGSNLDFRIDDNNVLYIKNGVKFYKVNL